MFNLPGKYYKYKYIHAQIYGFKVYKTKMNRITRVDKLIIIVGEINHY